MLSGLEKIVPSIAEMRNANGKYPKQDENVIIEEYKKLIGEYYDLVKIKVDIRNIGDI